MAPTDGAEPAARPPLPRAIWMLGFVSLLMDTSSELIHSLLPLFLVGPLGVGVAAVGLIEGFAEATALGVKVLSGTWSDRVRRRTTLAWAGYALATAAKPAFALAQGPALVVAARLLDRVGKGIRGAPRDALVADWVPPEQRGAAFGLRQSLDTVGASLGPLLASALMLAFHGDFRAVFWVAVLPAVASVAVMGRVPEPPSSLGADRGAAPPSVLAAWRSLSAGFWAVAAVGGVFTLARFSEAFLLLRARELGVSPALAPLILVVMNLACAGSAYPAGRLADARGKPALLVPGMAVLASADLTLAAARDPATLLLGVALWGLHLGLTQGVLAALVADQEPAERRGTAFGVFHLVCGLSTLLASALAGWLWDRHGPAAAFGTGAVLAGGAALLAGLGGLAGGRRRRRSP